jgi:hypothetical protein
MKDAWNDLLDLRARHARPRMGLIPRSSRAPPSGRHRTGARPDLTAGKSTREDARDASWGKRGKSPDGIDSRASLVTDTVTTSDLTITTGGGTIDTGRQNVKIKGTLIDFLNATDARSQSREAW